MLQRLDPKRAPKLIFNILSSVNSLKLYPNSIKLSYFIYLSLTGDASENSKERS